MPLWAKAAQLTQLIARLVKNDLKEVVTRAAEKSLRGSGARNGSRRIHSRPRGHKFGKLTRDKLIANYAQNIISCGKGGVKCVCYNFMPVFDWDRTNLYYKHADGSTSLSYYSYKRRGREQPESHLRQRNHVARNARNRGVKRLFRARRKRT